MAGQPHQALLVPPEATRAWIKPLVARRMSLPSRFAVCAARMAVHDALLGSEATPWNAGPRAAVCLGNTWGSTAYSLKLLQQIEERGPEAISPYLFMETVANAPAGQVALEHCIEGPNLTLTQREASDLSSVVRGAAMVATGRADHVLAGGVGEMSPILHAILSRFGALTGERNSQPFGKERDGMVPAEGSTIFVLESEGSALARGATIHARLKAWGRGNDPSASATDWGTGVAGLAEALRSALDRFEVAPETVERVVSGASGTTRGDALEARVLQATFGSELPQVLTPKAISGEYGGSFLASSLWASRTDVIPGGPAQDMADPDLGLVAATGNLKPARRSLITSLASGGPAAWLVLDRP